PGRMALTVDDKLADPLEVWKAHPRRAVRPVPVAGCGRGDDQRHLFRLDRPCREKAVDRGRPRPGVHRPRSGAHVLLLFVSCPLSPPHEIPAVPRSATFRLPDPVAARLLALRLE